MLMRAKGSAEKVRGSQVKESVELALMENMDSDTSEEVIKDMLQK